MRCIVRILLCAGILFTVGCNPNWEEYYNNYPETINENLWDAMQSDASISGFMQLMEQFELDTLFESDIPYTVLVPTNEATEVLSDSLLSITLLKYHICRHVINTSKITEKRKVQTLTEKYALFDRQGKVVLIDGVEVVSESPLYRNGRYLVMNEVVQPKPNLYEFYKATNPILSNFIDLRDSIVLDRELSIPIGYDENDNTIYDSVKYIVNNFEIEYFEVKHEFRNKTATIVFPLGEDYNAALDEMADELGPDYANYEDIPLDWQNSILVPYLINKGMFENELEPEAFIQPSPEFTLKMLNILGDSVEIDYAPAGKTLCSNGYAYNYNSFQIPEELYAGENRREGESLTYQTGVNKYTWRENVNVESSQEFLVEAKYSAKASNDSIVRVLFPSNYTGEFSVEFQSPSLFPRKYVMEIRTDMEIGGIYEIYINDGADPIKTFNYNEFDIFDGLMFSVESGEFYVPDGSLNSFDMHLEKDLIQEYGPVTIRIEYKGPGEETNNGFILDYVEFRPAKN